MFEMKDLELNLFQKEIVICDYDGVIQGIDILWTRKILEKKELFGKYFDFSKISDKDGNIKLNKILDRTDYYIDKYLLKEGKILPEKIHKKFIDLYMSDKDFYRKCPFLTMARALKILSYQDTISEIHFLSSYPAGYEPDSRKSDIINELYDTEKIHVHLIDSSIKKSDYINKNIPDYTCFIDDRPDIIKDVIENTKSTNKSFIMPYYKYNEDFIKDKEYLTEKYEQKVNVSFYSNDIA